MRSLPMKKQHKDVWYEKNPKTRVWMVILLGYPTGFRCGMISWESQGPTPQCPPPQEIAGLIKGL